MLVLHLISYICLEEQKHEQEKEDTGVYLIKGKKREISAAKAREQNTSLSAKPAKVGRYTMGWYMEYAWLLIRHPRRPSIFGGALQMAYREPGTYIYEYHMHPNHN
ncbi:hypothetical protein SLA2020_391840 [Shorea laevis]